MTRPWRASALVACALLILTACGDGEGNPTQQAAVFLGLEEAPVPPPFTIDLLVDGSLNSTANTETARQTIEVVVARLIPRPRSCARLWALGETVADATVLGQVCSPARLRNRKQQLDAEAHFRETATAYLVKAAQAAFTSPPPRRSPIAETITRIAMATPPTGERDLYLLSDGLQESTPAIGQFECAVLPSEAQWLAALDEERLLAAGSLEGARVEFCFTGFSDPKRKGCPTTARREVEMQQLWRAALTRAGCRGVSFSAMGPQLTPEVSP